jgi:hypothetical protein
MSTACTIDEAFSDPRLLGAALGDPSTWTAWRAILKATYGLPLTRPEGRTFAGLSGARKPPRKRVAELWVVAGRRSAKSRMAALIAVHTAAFLDHSAKLSPGEVGYVLVLSPSRGQARAVRDYAEGFLMASPALAGMLLPGTADEIRLDNGVVIATHASSFRTVRGKTLLCVILDEVAYFRDERSANPDQEIYRAVVPALITTGGMLIGISSPYRRVGLLHQKHRDHFGLEGDVLVIQAATTALNPTSDRKEIERARASDPEAARAEWDALWRSDISSLLGDEQVDAAIDHDRPLELPHRSDLTYRAFADMSSGRADHATICIGHREGDNVIVDVLRGRKPPFDPNFVAAEFATLAKSYGCREIVGDNYAAEFTVAAFRQAGVAYRRAELTRSKLYLEMVGPFMRGAVRLPNHPRLIRELRLLERRVAPSGVDRVDHGRAKGDSDDYANAVAGLLDLCSERRPPPATRVSMTDGLGVGRLRQISGPPPGRVVHVRHITAKQWQEERDAAHLAETAGGR